MASWRVDSIPSKKQDKSKPCPSLSSKSSFQISFHIFLPNLSSKSSSKSCFNPKKPKKKPLPYPSPGVAVGELMAGPPNSQPQPTLQNAAKTHGFLTHHPSQSSKPLCQPFEMRSNHMFSDSIPPSLSSKPPANPSQCYRIIWFSHNSLQVFLPNPPVNLSKCYQNIRFRTSSIQVFLPSPQPTLQNAMKTDGVRTIPSKSFFQAVRLPVRPPTRIQASKPPSLHVSKPPSLTEASAGCAKRNN